MGGPRFIHSLSTRPMLIDCYGIDSLRRLLAQVWYFSLSVAYLRRLGVGVRLHTDSLGLAVLGHLPYDEVRLTLDSWPGWIHPRFWAAGKFLSLAAEDGACVHIDGDVFVKREEALLAIDKGLSEGDLLAQSLDPACMYEMDAELFMKEADFCAAHGIVADGRDATNTGVLGVGSDEVRRALCDNYFEVVRHFSERYGKELSEGVILTPDLLAEQKMAEGFSRLRGWDVRLLLDNVSRAASIGYQHVYSIDKMNHMPQCIETLRRVAPDIYERTAKVCGGVEAWVGGIASQNVPKAAKDVKCGTI